MSYSLMSYYKYIKMMYFIATVLSQERCADEENQFLCPDGSCISREYVCDGSSDCIGGADETRDTCEFRFCSTSIEFFNRREINQFSISESKQFRCNYGACISPSFVCDGITNCRDGSDESDEQCRNNTCSPVEFRCNYGGCIPLNYVCNGVLSCYDGSDETYDVCKNHICNLGYTAQCAYGACIRKTLICNGVVNCHDESDESEELCGKGHKYRSYLQSPPYTPQTTTERAGIIPETSSSSILNGSGCSAINPEDTSYELHLCGGLSCDDDILPIGTEITAHCIGDQFYDLICNETFNWVSIDNHKLSMSQICVPEAIPPSHSGIPEAIEMGCSTVNFRSSFDVLRCGRRQPISDCNTKQVMPVGSILTQDCNPSDTVIMFCKSDKTWQISSENGEQRNITSCQIDVARLRNECGQTKRLVGEAAGFSWPFLVGLFKNQEYICTGTLISYNIVLTSGHCLTRNKASSVDFISPVNLKIQHYKRGKIIFTPVSSIHMHPQYRGGNRPRYDVAIIRLTRFATSEDEFEPVCLDTIGSLINKPAMVFNRTEGNSNFSWTEFSQSLDLSCFNRNTPCSRHLDIDRNQFCGINLSSDKFLHAGSSGGPYIIRMVGNQGENRWAIAGIVSHSVKTVKKKVEETPCRKPHTVYASVFHLQKWISECAFNFVC